MDKDFKELVIARYRCLPNRYTVNCGQWSGKAADIIKEIEQETPIGFVFYNADRNLLLSLKHWKMN